MMIADKFVGAIAKARSLSDAARPFFERSEFRPRNFRIDCTEARKRAKATIGAGHNPLAADDIDEMPEALSDEVRMLDEIRRGIDDPRHQHHVVWDLCRSVAKHGPFVPVPRIGGFEQDITCGRPHQQRKDLGHVDVAAMRAFVVAPADMKANAVAR